MKIETLTDLVDALADRARNDTELVLDNIRVEAFFELVCDLMPDEQGFSILRLPFEPWGKGYQAHLSRKPVRMKAMSRAVQFVAREAVSEAYDIASNEAESIGFDYCLKWFVQALGWPQSYFSIVKSEGEYIVKGSPELFQLTGWKVSVVLRTSLLVEVGATRPPFCWPIKD